MKIKKVELRNFKRFTHLIVESIPESARLVVMVGPNGSGKTSFIEAFNHYYKRQGYSDYGEYNYLSKLDNENPMNYDRWNRESRDIVNIQFYGNGETSIKGHFYFRSAYRNEPQFIINSMEKQNDPTQTVRLKKLIDNDQTVSKNYQRLVANTISGVFNDENNTKTVKNLRDELIGKIQSSLDNIFDDLNLSSIGKPLENGGFYFKKGIVKNFDYKNLSAGEKSAFDLILDLVIQSEYFKNAVYCIDEPETHMHTNLQGKVLRELYNIIPNDSQLWISTHSIGMLHEAEKIEKEYPESVVFLDFGDKDYDDEQTITPCKLTRTIREKFYELAFGDFSNLMLPESVVLCEGSSVGNKRKDFDKTIYSKIFEAEYPDVLFMSGGSCNDILSIESNQGGLLNNIFKHTKLIKIIDRDDRSEEEVKALAERGIMVLKERNIESYLLNQEIITKFCKEEGKEDKIGICLQIRENAIKNSIAKENAEDDLKSAKGEIYNQMKTELGLTGCGNSADAFISYRLAPLVTPDTETYKQLKKDIFGNSEEE